MYFQINFAIFFHLIIYILSQFYVHTSSGMFSSGKFYFLFFCSYDIYYEINFSFILSTRYLNHVFFFLSALLSVTYRIALVVKERNVMNSNKNEHKPLSDVRYNSTGCSEGLLLIGVWLYRI